MLCYPKYTFGKRFFDKQEDNSPGPGKYNPDKQHTLFNIKFGKSIRDFTKTVSSPGPVEYSPLKVSLKNYPAFSIGQKLNIKDNSFNPGPGQYEPNKSSQLPNIV